MLGERDMRTCQNCHNKWSWKQTFKRSFTLGGGMICPYCEEKQYVSARMRKRGSLIPLIIIPMIMSGNLFFGPSYIALFALIGIIPLYAAMYPFFAELSNKEELF